MKETLAQFAARIGVTLWPRTGGVLAIIPMPDKFRPDAYCLSDYYVSASVSGPCLEFTPRPDLFKASWSFRGKHGESKETTSAAQAASWARDAARTARAVTILKAKFHGVPACNAGTFFLERIIK